MLWGPGAHKMLFLLPRGRGVGRDWLSSEELFVRDVSKGEGTLFPLMRWGPSLAFTAPRTIEAFRTVRAG